MQGPNAGFVSGNSQGHRLGSAADSSSAKERSDTVPRSGQSTVGADEEKIAQLQAMGFDRAECIQALEASNGNVEMAAGLLL